MTTEQLKNRIDSLLADNTELAGYYAARAKRPCSSVYSGISLFCTRRVYE